MYKMDSININQSGIWRRFFRMLAKARLPYFWILVYIATSFGLTHLDVNVTEYTAEMFAGNVSFSGVIVPFIIFSLVSLLISTINGVINYVVLALIDRNLRRMVWQKIVHLKMSYFDRNEPSELLSRITTDTNTISTLIMRVFVGTITSLYSFGVLAGRIISYDPMLILGLVICVPLVIVIPGIMGKYNFGVSDSVNRTNAELTQGISEKVNNLETIKAFGTEEKELENGGLRMLNYYKARIRNSWIGQISSPMYRAVSLLQTLIIILIGRHYYMTGAIDLTQWIAYFAFSATFMANLTSFAGDWDNFKLAQGSTNRVTHIMEAEEEDLTSGEEAKDLSGDILLKDVVFSYDGVKEILHRLSLKIPEGKATVIVGPSGSGKSTILNLLDRFYEIGEGEVTIGGRDVSDFDLKSYRKIFTCITQNSVPVSGTIRDNLTYGLEREVSDEELKKACMLSDAWDFISEYPAGLDEPISEEGKNLSGGQRQRMALAKVFITDTPYIILDEATSAMDVKSTDVFLTNLMREKKGKTIIMVAHNRQAARFADNIAVLIDGNIEASGSLEEVTENSSFFRTMSEGEDDNEE